MMPTNREAQNWLKLRQEVMLRKLQAEHQKKVMEKMKPLTSINL